MSGVSINKNVILKLKALELKNLNKKKQNFKLIKTLI